MLEKIGPLAELFKGGFQPLEGFGLLELYADEVDDANDIDDVDDIDADRVG